METNSHQEPVGLCLIPIHWAQTNTMKGSSCISNGIKTAIGIGFGSGFEDLRKRAKLLVNCGIKSMWHGDKQPSGACWTVSDPSLGSYEHNKRVQLHLKWCQDCHRHWFWLRFRGREPKNANQLRALLISTQ
jgi:hypothetical protein